MTGDQPAPPAERCRDIAHVSAVELRTAVPEQTVDFFVRLLGMSEVARDGAAHLRACLGRLRAVHRVRDRDAPDVRASAGPGCARPARRRCSAGCRPSRPAGTASAGPTAAGHRPDLPVHRLRRPRDGAVLGDRVVRGAGGAAPGAEEPGRAVPRPGRQRAPDRPRQLPGRGHPGGRPVPPGRARRRSSPSRSCSMTGSRRRSGTTWPTRATTWCTPATGPARPGRLHHVAFATDQREDILRAADVMLEAGIHIETGPHKHAIQQTFFLYVWEPGGNRIELCNAGARLVLAPDWRPISWTPGRAGQGPGVGAADDRDVPHPRHAAGGRGRRAARMTAARRRSPWPCSGWARRAGASPGTWPPPGSRCAASTRPCPRRPASRPRPATPTPAGAPTWCSA